MEKYNPNKGVPAYWVKKLVSGKEWETRYGKDGSYCKLSNDGGDVWVGFLTLQKEPVGCLALTDEELRQVDCYRRARNIAPCPLEEIK